MRSVLEKEKCRYFYIWSRTGWLTCVFIFCLARLLSFLCRPQKPVTQVNDVGADLRTTAFLQPAKSFMESLGLWGKLEPHAIPMDVMRIIDAEGDKWPPREIITKDFLASDISELPFGWNIPNWL